MAREIKFRAWYKDEEKIYEVKGLSFSSGELYAVELWSDEGTLDGKWHEYSVYIRDVELMQYTGLKDCKGEEIYEGDIVKDGNWIGQVPAINEMIEMAIGDGMMPDYKHGEIIGNIYEHPHLLEQKKG